MNWSISHHAEMFETNSTEPFDLHAENSNIWGPKIDKMKISEYKIIPEIRKTLCTVQNEVHFVPDSGVSFLLRILKVIYWGSANSNSMMTILGTHRVFNFKID